MTNYCRNCGERIPEKKGNNILLWCNECRDLVDKELKMGKYSVAFNTIENIVSNKNDMRKEIDELEEKVRKQQTQINALLFTIEMKDAIIRELREEIKKK